MKESKGILIDSNGIFNSNGILIRFLLILTGL